MERSWYVSTYEMEFGVTDIQGPEHARLKDYVSAMPGQLSAAVHEGGNSRSTPQFVQIGMR